MQLAPNNCTFIYNGNRIELNLLLCTLMKNEIENEIRVDAICKPFSLNEIIGDCL